jgi:hypothetical protein
MLIDKLNKQFDQASQKCVAAEQALADARKYAEKCEAEFNRITDLRWDEENRLLRKGTAEQKLAILGRRLRGGFAVDRDAMVAFKSA